MRRINGRWFYSHSPNCKERKKKCLKEKKRTRRIVLFPLTQLQRKKKNGFEREEEDGKDGFIHIHTVAKKERKKGLKDKKIEDGEDEEMELG